MNLIDLLLTIANELESQGVVYALTGSIASSLYGQPLPSLDADLAVRMTPDQARTVARSLQGRLYVSAEALVDAATRSTMANVIDGASGFKVDLSVLPRTAFCDEVFKRRRLLAMPDESGRAIWICSPEDVILMKLPLHSYTQSEKQLHDAMNVVTGQREQLDWGYMERWAAQQHVMEDLRILREQSRP